MKKLVFYFITFLIPLLIIMFMLSWYGTSKVDQFINVDVKVIGDPQLALDRDIGYARKKDAKTRRIQAKASIDYTIYTDHIGARVNNDSEDTGKNISILTVGGSFSEGHGLANESTYTEHLGKKFKVPVANLSLASYGGVQALLTLKRFKILKPKLIIYGMIEDHMRRNITPCAPSYLPFCIDVPIVSFTDSGEPFIKKLNTVSRYSGLQLRLDLVNLKQHPSFLNKVLVGLKIAVYETVGISAKLRKNGTENTKVNKIKSAIFVVKQMYKVAEELNAKLIVLYMPSMVEKSIKPVSRFFASELPEDVLLVDASEGIKKYYAQNSNKKPYLTENDKHPNAIAHRIFADLISEVITTNHLTAQLLAEYQK